MRAKPDWAVVVAATALGVDMFLYSSVVPLVATLPAVHGSPLISGTLFASYAAALLAATPPVGIWVDRAGHRAPMLAGLIGLAAATGLFSVAVASTGTSGLVLLLAARAAQGIAAAVSWTAGLALIAATHEPHRRGRAMGVALSAVGAGMLLGPAVSGAVASAFGLRAPFVVVAVLALVDAIARLVLIRPTAKPAARTALLTLLRGPQTPRLVWLTMMAAAALAFPEPILPLHLRHLGIGVTGIGAVFAGSALTGTVTAVVAGHWTDRLGPTRLASIGSLVTATGFVLSGRDEPVITVLGVLVIGAGAQLILAPTLVLVGGLAEHSEPPAYGAAFAIYDIAYTGGLALAPILAGITTKATNVATATVVAAALMTALAITMATRTARPDITS